MNDTPHRILVVDDEPSITEFVSYALKKEGFFTDVVDNGEDALALATKNSYDLFVLDIMLPGMDGFEVLGHIREKHDTPIIMLTAREEETDKVLGLELGADDYITKPFSMRELMARVKANMRRTLSGEERAKPAVPSGGGLRISRDNGMVYKNGRALELSAREFDILCYLSASPGHVFSREELMEHVWGSEYYGDLRAVDVAIRRLRETVEDQPARPRYLMTKRGMGSYFAREG